MALPVVVGKKTETERFAGAIDTLCIEAMMQDGKALQAGTSHFLGQNFAKAFDVQFANKEGKLDYVWATSWGVSTRLMGALIMAHSDDNGLVLPPALAPIQVVMVPIYKGEEELKMMVEKMEEIKNELKPYGISVKIDDRDNVRSGFKFAEWELKGVPVRVVMGKRDLENGVVEIVVGSTLHPMLPEHFIGWVAIETKEGNQRKVLSGDPKISFALTEGDELIAVYAYCNLHGLWKTEA
jgi:prolyl-tRNA synthetase